MGSSEEERGRLLIDHLLRSMNPKLRGQVAQMVDGKAVQDRPDYWQLVKFALKKEAEINFDDAKKVSKPKGTTYFKFNRKKTSLPVYPTVWMVAPVPEEEVGTEEVTPLLTEDSDSGESYMRLHQMTHLSPQETSRWLSGSLVPLKLSQEGWVLILG